MAMKDEHDTVTKELKIKPTAKTNAQRQREYRERARKELSRIDMRIDFSANRELEDMAKYYTVTKKEMLEKLIKQAHEAWLDEIGTQAYGEWVKKKNGV
ncbi:hypothetical protein P8S54_11100 (plasmid) [Thiomicrospira sp. R3]|uniref:hypothetical protein n=1 Tax=Thiomicrospira sp. R3 TaxID=3035472 RepID=UPI00259B4DB5|nr:hypothetical protein [Thiomicrospira sp. R3]WFE69835.1 hypothetical protein P8S54_11100 [Thiomicrospira sp. R3]